MPHIIRCIDISDAMLRRYAMLIFSRHDTYFFFFAMPLDALMIHFLLMPLSYAAPLLMFTLLLSPPILLSCRFAIYMRRRKAYGITQEEGITSHNTLRCFFAAAAADADVVFGSCRAPDYFAAAAAAATLCCHAADIYAARHCY